MKVHLKEAAQALFHALFESQSVCACECPALPACVCVFVGSFFKVVFPKLRVGEFVLLL